MYKKLRNAFKISLVAMAAIFTLMTVDVQETQAQDWGRDDYCIPDAMEWGTSIIRNATNSACFAYYAGFSWYCGYYFGSIWRVSIETTTGEELMVSETLEDQTYGGHLSCYTDSKEYHNEEEAHSKAQVFSGGDYVVRVNTHLFTYCYQSGWWSFTYCGRSGYTGDLTSRMNIWIDYNNDGDFEDANELLNGMNLADGVEEIDVPGRWDEVLRACEDYEWVYKFKAPDNTGVTRMRIMAAGDWESGGSWPNYGMERWSETTPWGGFFVQPDDKAAGVSNPGGACWNGLWRPYSWSYQYGETEDYYLDVVVPFKSTFPSNEVPNNVIWAGEDYNGEYRYRNDDDDEMTYFENPMVEFMAPMDPGIELEYKIVGPLPSQTAVYTATDAGGNTRMDVTGLEKIVMENAYGQFANADGSLNIELGGEYHLQLTIHFPGRNPANVTMNFFAAYENDLAVVQTLSPRTNVEPRFFKYPANIPIEMTALVQAVGVNNVVKFRATAEIYQAWNNQRIARYTVDYDTAGTSRPVLTTGDAYQVDFPNFTTSTVGEYYVVYSVELLNAPDGYSYNDRYAREDEDEFTFEVQHEIQPAIDGIIVPNAGQTFYAGRPFQPELELINFGVQDVSDTEATLVIRDENSVVLYEETVNVNDIPSGRYNLKSVLFNYTTIMEPGTYTATFTIFNQFDGDDSDNEMTSTFTVLGGLNNNQTPDGYFTIGQRNAGQSHNFLTVDDAIRALYGRGMSGDVTMKFTDKVYNLYADNNGNKSPFDLSTAIVGLGENRLGDETYELKFMPADNASTSKGNVTINLHTYTADQSADAGIGVRVGQNTNWVHENSVAYLVRGYDSLYKSYLNNGGHITFDGGSKKALRFVVKSLDGHPGAKAFYLGNGANNVTIKNTIIEHADAKQRENVWLPQSNFSFADGFVFDDDMVRLYDAEVKDTVVYSYSSAVASRSKLERVIEDNDVYILDTLKNFNITVEDNEISNFGYGFVSLGMGTVINSKTRLYDDYYTENTVVNGNKMYNLGRAGIVLGFNRGSKVRFNTIFDVNGNYNNGVRVNSYPYNDAAGIILGDQLSKARLGYNNVDVTVEGNTISNINAEDIAYGIKLYQAINGYSNPTEGTTYTPFAKQTTPGDNSFLNDNRDWLNISSNAIWDLDVTNVKGHKVGIHVTTQRKIPTLAVDQDKDANFYANELENWLTPLNTVEGLDELTIANNTVIIDNDNINNEGLLVGIGLQQATNTNIVNNAISIKDMQVNNEVAAAIMLNTALPMESNIEFDNNIYYVENKNNVDVVRHIETYHNGTLRNAGFKDEYNTVNQWKGWSHTDITSVEGYDFTQEYRFFGSYPQTIVGNTTNNLASVLNNRGMRVDNVTYDINGNIRGTAGDNYDVGAIEFSPNIYKSDAELVYITKPGNWKAPNGSFSDAEYIMTTAPIDIEYILRNAGTNDDLDADVTLNIYRMNPLGQWVTEMTLNEEVYIGLQQFKTLSWNLADGIGDEFVPMTYADLHRDGSTYDVPSHFEGMEHNVTPLYRIEILVDGDENSANNRIFKDVRFHIQRSPIKLIESRTRAITKPLSEMSEIERTEHYNSMALAQAFERMGYMNQWLDLDESERYEIDRMNRGGWEPRSVNYNHYTSVLWVDGHDYDESMNPVTLTRYERENIDDFLNSGSNEVKANFIAYSQELVRNNRNTEIPSVLKVGAQYPYTPLTNLVDESIMLDYDGKTVSGIKMARDEEYTINAVQGTYGDTPNTLPMPGLLAPINNGTGLAEIGMIYDEVNDEEAPEMYRAMAIGATTIDRNIAIIGVDWRHFNNIEMVTRGVLDYIESNNGTVIPVELVSFDANKAGNRVDISWVTASEEGSARFEVEKAIANESGDDFAKIATVPAQGYTTDAVQYGPVHDNEVTSGETYIYRLKMVDLDGSFDYSGERVVEFGENGLMTLGEVNPNPVNTTATLDFSVSESSNVTIEVYDMTGKVVATLVNGTVNTGNNTVTLNPADFTNGIYQVVMTSGSTVLTTKFTVAK